jgi:hypothetical protein
MSFVPQLHFPTLMELESRSAPFHVYFSKLWDIKYKRYFYDICDHFLSPLYTIIFGFPRYRISSEARVRMKGITDWYLGKYYTYVRVYGTIGAPHIFHTSSPSPFNEINIPSNHKNMGYFLSHEQ